MKAAGPIAFILVIALTVAIGIGIIEYCHGSERDLPEGSSPIHYNLDGGSLQDGYVSYYYPGEYTPLPEAHKEGKTFAGWFRDRNLTVPVGALLGDDKGTVRLYAGWMDSIVGHRIVMNYSAFTSLIQSGTVTWKYLAVDGDGNYYIERTTQSTGFIGPGSKTVGYWTDEAGSDDNFRYVGNQTVRWGMKEYVCQVWQSMKGETQWIYNNIIPLRANVIQDGMYLTYSIQDYSAFESDTSMTVKVVADVGSGVSGSLETIIGSKVTLKATGDFYGWFHDNELVSDNPVLVVPRATPGDVYELRGYKDPMEIHSLKVNTEDLGLTGNVVITSSSGATDTHKAGDMTFRIAGYFTITDSSTPVVKQVRIHIDVTYGIEYVLNGGVLPDDAVTTYSYGTYTDLPIPTNGTKFFEGWYSDEACTIPFGAITKDVSGDVTLYASWTDSKLGEGFTMNYLYTPHIIINGSGTISGTVTWKNVAMDSKGNYYVERTRNVNGNVTTAGYWSDEPNDTVFKYIGNQSVSWSGKEYLCEVWQSTSGEKQWIYRSFLPLMITGYTTGGTVKYTISETVTFEPSAYYQIEVVADVGLEVSGADNVPEVGSGFELTAEGDDFYAWYVDGALKTNDRTLVVDRATPGVRYEARASSEYITLDDGVVNARSYGLNGPVTIVYEDGTSKTFSSGIVTLDQPGYAVITDSGYPVSKQIRAFADLEGTFSAEWEFNGTDYKFSMPMRYSDVFSYTLNDQYSDRRDHKTDELVNRYFTPDDKYVQQIVEYLSDMRDKGNMSETAFAGFVMRFVQSIPYKEDMATRNSDEFWKYPAEYLWDGAGDCEDSSILYATLMYAMGYDAGILVFYNHAMAAIHLDGDLSGYKNVIELNGKRYVFVETTDAYITESDPDGFQLGDSYGTGYTPGDVMYYYLVSASQ